MAAFRKGHVKAVKWMVHRVTQFPSDQEMNRYVSTISLNEKVSPMNKSMVLIFYNVTSGLVF